MHSTSQVITLTLKGGCYVTIRHKQPIEVSLESWDRVDYQTVHQLILIHNFDAILRALK